MPQVRQERGARKTDAGREWATGTDSSRIQNRREKLLRRPAGRTAQFLAHVLQPPLQRGHPVMTGMRRILPHVLLMPAIQFRHPIAVFIHMKTDNFAQHPGRLGLQGLHTAILRAFEGPRLLKWRPGTSSVRS